MISVLAPPDAFSIHVCRLAATHEYVLEVERSSVWTCLTQVEASVSYVKVVLLAISPEKWTSMDVQRFIKSLASTLPAKTWIGWVRVLACFVSSAVACTCMKDEAWGWSMNIQVTLFEYCRPTSPVTVSAMHCEHTKPTWVPFADSPRSGIWVGADEEFGESDTVPNWSRSHLYPPWSARGSHGHFRWCVASASSAAHAGSRARCCGYHRPRLHLRARSETGPIGLAIAVRLIAGAPACA